MEDMLAILTVQTRRNFFLLEKRAGNEAGTRSKSVC